MNSRFENSILDTPLHALGKGIHPRERRKPSAQASWRPACWCVLGTVPSQPRCPTSRHSLRMLWGGGCYQGRHAQFLPDSASPLDSVGGLSLITLSCCSCKRSAADPSVSPCLWVRGHRCIASFEKELAGWGRGMSFQFLPGFLDSHLQGYS